MNNRSKQKYEIGENIKLGSFEMACSGVLG